MTLYYCKSWFRARKKPTEMWAEEQARQAHEQGNLYTVLVGSAEKPTCFLEVTQKAVGVSFLDDALREKLSYSFQETQPGTMFLSMATYRNFVGDTDVVAEGTNYIFGESGEVSIQRRKPRQASIETSKTTSDVRGNYEAKPSFGKYDDLIKVERYPLQK
jgi:hypothetical protein